MTNYYQTFNDPTADGARVARRTLQGYIDDPHVEGVSWEEGVPLSKSHCRALLAERAVYRLFLDRLLRGALDGQPHTWRDARKLLDRFEN